MINVDSDRAKKELDLETWKKRWAVLAVVPITVLAFVLRYLPARDMEYLQALDPYFLTRMSQQIAYSGGLPPLDFMSYFPYSLPTYIVDQGIVWIPAILHNLGLGLFFDTYVEYAQFFTPFIGALTVFAFYFLGKELFNKTTGISAAFFLAIIPGVMRRSSAGFFEKEALGGFFMILSMYMFVRAWKRNEWISGIGSGLALGLFSISWGGSQMTWLLYPLVVFATLFIDADLRSLIIAYTPTVIVGASIPLAVDPRGFGITSSILVGNLALLAFLWSRYAIQELSLMDEEYQPYYVPVVTIVGFTLVHFSALYSSFIANRYQGLLGKIPGVNLGGSSSAGAVIGGTVAENAQLGVNELATQLNTVYAGGISPVLGAVSNIFGTWPLSFIGIGLLSTTVVMMLADRYEVIDGEISHEYYLGGFLATYTVWTLFFARIFQNPIAAVAPPTLVVIGGSILYYFVLEPETQISINQRWYLMLPFFWALTNILGASSRSRLIFLAAFPVAFMSGYTLSKVIGFIRGLELDDVTDRASGKEIKMSGIIAISALMVMTGVSAGYASSQGITGSPNQPWMQTLDYMENQTAPDSVVLSWWDYGYHIESIGERAAVADGGNRRFMTSNGGNKLPLNIADFLTSNGSNPHLLEKHSVDYIVLDQPMISKYSAVSTIANRGNRNETLQLLSFTTNNLRQSTAIDKEDGTGVATLGNSITGLQLNVPLNVTEAGQFTLADISGPPEAAVSGAKPKVSCMIRSDGTVKEFDGVENPLTFGEKFGEMCVAEGPYYTLDRGLTYNSSASLVLVPRKLTDNVFVQLMFGDGEQLEWADKVQQGSNGYVKLWKVDREE